MTERLSFREYQEIQQELSEETMAFPNQIIWRRIAIRQFPNGKSVAVYYSDYLKRYFTYPTQFE